jgi:hypothetical protein
MSEVRSGDGGHHRQIDLIRSRIEAGGLLPGVPIAHLRDPFPSSGAAEHEVAGGHLHAGLLFPRLEILDVDWRPRLAPGHALSRGMSIRIPRVKMPSFTTMIADF